MKEGYNRVYVGSLSWEITEEELKKFFSNCNIKSIRLGMDKETGEFRGYAHVDFSDSKSLKTALALDQSVLFGRPVRISCAVPLKKKSDAGEKSVAGSKPGAGEKSVAGYEPGSGEKSVASSKPVSGEKSVAGSKPGAGEKSAADEKPDAEERETVEKPPSSVVSGGKRKNRMCYGCRQKGHNLSECPNQQTVASTTV
jgi:nucleolin